MQELTTKMVADGTYLLWDLLIFHVYRRWVWLRCAYCVAYLLIADVLASCDMLSAPWPV